MTVVLSYGGLAAPLDFAYPVAGVGITVWLLNRHEREDALEYVVWLWLLDPEIRRFIDYRSHFHPASPIIATAGIASLVLGLFVVLRPRSGYRDFNRLVAMLVAVLFFGLAIGLLHDHVAAASADFVLYAGPLAMGVFVLRMSTADVDLHARLQSTATGAVGILGVYGLIQFLVAPPWDTEWMRASGITSLGSPTAFHVRVFSTLDSAGPFAQVMVVLLLIAFSSTASRGKIRTLALTVGIVAVGLSLVRAAWIAALVGVAFLLITRRVRMGQLLIAAIAVVVGIASFGGPVRTAIASRLDSSVQSGSSDTSFSARTNFQVGVTPTILARPAGAGLGSSGVAARVPGSDSTPAYGAASFDSGWLQILSTFGSIPGSLLLLALCGAVSAVCRRSRAQPRFFAWVAAAALGLTVSLLFTDTVNGVYGAVLWLLLGLGARPHDSVVDPQSELQSPSGASRWVWRTTSAFAPS